MTGVSGLLSTYLGDNARFLGLVLDSLEAQTRPLDELVVVFDGPVSKEQRQAFDQRRNTLKIRTLELPGNAGLGAALAAGVHECRLPYIARVDTDDLSAPRRIELQSGFLDANPDIAAVGAWATEFEGVPENIISIRKLPCDHDQLVRFSRRRSPMNHPTVMLRKDAVIKVGNYAPYRQAQDYHLWVRLLLQGYKLANLPEVLVNMSAGVRLGKKRGGLKRLNAEIAIQREFRRMGFISSLDFATNVVLRTMVRLSPNAMRRVFYRFAWRDNGMQSRGDAIVR